MRHKHKFRKLNRTSSHRIAMLRNMSISLFKYEHIKTTLVKAKELRSIVESLITLGKVDTLANRRIVFNRIRDRNIVKKIFDELSKFYLNFCGGYSRILKIGFRKGDNSQLALIQLVGREYI